MLNETSLPLISFIRRKKEKKKKKKDLIDNNIKKDSSSTSQQGQSQDYHYSIKAQHRGVRHGPILTGPLRANMLA